MDEYNTGMDPEIRQYFRKIMSSFFWGLLWLLGMVTAGIFFKLGVLTEGVRWYHIVFYLLAVVTFILLIRKFYKTWRK